MSAPFDDHVQTQAGQCRAECIPSAVAPPSPKPVTWLDDHLFTVLVCPLSCVPMIWMGSGVQEEMHQVARHAFIRAIQHMQTNLLFRFCQSVYTFIQSLPDLKPAPWS